MFYMMLIGSNMASSLGQTNHPCELAMVRDLIPTLGASEAMATARAGSREGPGARTTHKHISCNNHRFRFEVSMKLLVIIADYI